MRKKLGLHLILLLLLNDLCFTTNAQEMKFVDLHTNMVVDQLIKRGIKDSLVIRAMEKVERHLFVPKHLQKYAYQDRPLPIDEGQTISQPYIVGFMSEQLKLNSNSRVLEIGTGSGYQAAVLGEICKEVYSIEIVKSLQERAAYLLDSLKYQNVSVFFADGYLGLPAHAPFDAIIVTCSPTDIPEALVEQLAESGRMIIPVGKKSVKKLVLVTKQKGRIAKQNVLPVRFVPMVNKRGNWY